MASVILHSFRYREIQGQQWICFELTSETSAAKWIRVHAFEELLLLYSELREQDAELPVLPSPLCGKIESRLSVMMEFIKTSLSQECFKQGTKLYANRKLMLFFDICNPWRAAAHNDAYLLAFCFQVMGLSVNLADPHGITALHLTHVFGYMELSQQLAAIGADFSRRDRNGHTPEEAARAAHQSSFQAIAEGSPILPAAFLTFGKGYREYAEPANRYLMFLNPFSGTRLAPRIFRESVAPVFDLCNVVLDVRETTKIGHATEIIKSLTTTEFLSYKGVFSVSGDGVLNEIIHGIMSRPDFQQINVVPIGIVPAGSGNGMAKSLDFHNPVYAAQRIVHGSTTPLDIGRLEQRLRPMAPPVIRYSHLSLSWGIISDVDLESERWRFLGYARFTLSAAIKLIQLNTFPARLAILPAAGSGPYDGIRTTVQAPTASSFRPAPHIGEGWLEMEDNFSMFIAANVPWISRDTCLAPHAKFADGAFDIVISREHRGETEGAVHSPTRAQMIATFLNIDKAEWVSSGTIAETVEYIKAAAFRIEPLPVRPGDRTTVYSLDGEHVDDNNSPIELSVIPSALSILGIDIRRHIGQAIKATATAK